MNVADTDLAAVMLIVQVSVPEHAPLQPAKVWPVAGVATSATPAPDVYDALQILPQLIPPVPVTLPLPLTLTLSA